jgi:hypothetical protein
MTAVLFVPTLLLAHGVRSVGIPRALVIIPRA